MTVEPRRSDQPVSGHYLMRLVRGGPFVAAEIRCDDGQWTCMVDGNWSGPSADPWLLPDLEKVHWFGRATTEAEAKFKIGLRRWAEIHAPSHPAANPNKPINLDTLKPPI